MGFIEDVINGVKMMIEGFKRIICFFGSIPRRISNINSSLSNIFKGINLEFIAIGKSWDDGMSSISLLGMYIGEIIATNIGCGFKFAGNFFECIFFYIVDIILFILYLPVLIMLWVFDEFLDLDLSYIPDSAYAGLKSINDFQYPYTGVSIIYWPKSVREKCYLCKRLKSSAVDAKAKEVGVTFNEKIPNNFGKSRTTFNRAMKQFNEVFALVPRNPSDVH